MTLDQEPLVGKLRRLERLGEHFRFGLGLRRQLRRAEEERQAQVCAPILNCRRLVRRFGGVPGNTDSRAFPSARRIRGRGLSRRRTWIRLARVRLRTPFGRTEAEAAFCPERL